MLGNAKWVDFEGQRIARQRIERQLSITAAVVHLPRTHNHIARIGHSGEQAVVLKEELKRLTQARGDGVFAALRKRSQGDFCELRFVQLTEVHAIADATVVVLTHAIVHFVTNAVGILVSVFTFA